MSCTLSPPSQINVLEYMHSRGYVHADIKGANILLGTGKSGTEHCYLVDFGLANHYSKKEYKPDPKNAHNGTIEYTSRDAHAGVSTMRGDMEILGLNFVHWLGLDLPWESQKMLADAKKVHEAKQQYMKSLDKQLSGAPDAVKGFMKYVEKMGHDETPDYEKCRALLEKGLKGLGKTDKGPLEFDMKAVDTSAPAASTKMKTPTPRKRARVSSTSPVIRKSPLAGTSRRRVLSETPSPEVYVPRETSKRKASSGGKKTPVSVKDDSSVIILDSPLTDIGPTPRTAEDVRQKVKEQRTGRMIVNNDITPKTTTAKRAKKTYEFNFELDVSVEADVVVNVKRKKKEVKTPSDTPVSAITASGRKRTSAKTSTPSTPISPLVRKRIARNVKVTPSGTVHVEKG